MSKSIELLLSVALTPIILFLWGAVFPVTDEPEFDGYDFEAMKKRNKWINNISVALHFVGLCLPIPFLVSATDSDPELVPWGIALVFGSMVIVPFVFVTAITLPQGIKRFREYWRFYELHYGIGIRGIKAVFVPIGLIGIAALWKIT